MSDIVRFLFNLGVTAIGMAAVFVIISIVMRIISICIFSIVVGFKMQYQLLEYTRNRKEIKSIMVKNIKNLSDEAITEILQNHLRESNG